MSGRSSGLDIAGRLLAQLGGDLVASDAYAVIPLFVLDGALRVEHEHGARHVRRRGVAAETASAAGLGIATVAANAVFAACTGTTIASASVFTKVAVPEMIRHGHTPEFSVGVVAGSSVLGMLIPPSILFIIFGVIANVSIADLFKSGILPGILLSVAFCITILLLASFRRDFVLADPRAAGAGYSGPLDDAPAWAVAVKLAADRHPGRYRARRHLWRLPDPDGGRRRGRSPPS